MCLRARSTDALRAREVQRNVSNLVAGLDQPPPELDWPLRWPQARDLLRALSNVSGSAPIARATVMNSIPSSRRSPPSYLATNDCGRPSRLARACWVSPAFLRVRVISSQRARYSGLWTDLRMPRARGAMGAAG